MTQRIQKKDYYYICASIKSFERALSVFIDRKRRNFLCIHFCFLYRTPFQRKREVGKIDNETKRNNHFIYTNLTSISKFMQLSASQRM